jgi:hypothetical protein
MSRSSWRRVRMGGLAVCAVLAFSARARAATDCSTLPGAIVYGAGGSAQEPVVAQIASQLAALPSPISIVYNDTGSACVGYQDLVTPTTITGGQYWDTGLQQLSSCTQTAPATVSFAIMGNTPKQCPQTTGLAAGFGQFLGPVQSIDFVVPAQSNEQSISTEAAYYIWGFAGVGANTVAPWSVPANIFTRSSSSFLTIFVGLDTGLSASRIALPYSPVGDAAAPANPTQVKTNQLTVQGLNALNSSSPQSGIGFVSGEVADGARGQVKVLAYQHTDLKTGDRQSCGYYPDSTKDAFDKINVRTGQYWLWSPIHFFAAVTAGADATKVTSITDPNVQKLVGWFTGDVAPPTGVNIFAAEVNSSTVPKCAMQAWRDDDLAPPYSYPAPQSCTCQFDLATKYVNKAASCQTCASDTDCTVTHHCRNIGPPLNPDAGAANVGYCEVN